MWKCSYCMQDFDFSSVSERGNHSRWCKQNPKRSQSIEGPKKAIQLAVALKLGDHKNFEVVCENCQTLFFVKEREKQFPKREHYFCSRSCANTRKNWHQSRCVEPVFTYREICFKHHNRRCIVCGESKIVAVHHLNENHNDNSPENLIPLCPTHHLYWHSKYKSEIYDIVMKYVESRS